jgi:hypothetical protein
MARVLVAGELVVMAGRHLGKLDAEERSRLIALLTRARGRPSSLHSDEREELLELIARLEPRVLVASTVSRLSPVPVPGRLLFGRRARRTGKSGSDGR